jgi:hypothetical protein
MTSAVQRLLEAFDALTDPEKQEAASEVLRRAADLASGPLPEQALVEAADELFRELDAREAADAQS